MFSLTEPGRTETDTVAVVVKPLLSVATAVNVCVPIPIPFVVRPYGTVMSGAPISTPSMKNWTLAIIPSRS